MKFFAILSVFSLMVISFQPQLLAQQVISIQPYLQDAEPGSIFILWETNAGEESIVEWGLSDTLGNTSAGISYPSNGGTEMVHEVNLHDLIPGSKYYYRVKTGTAVSEVFHFKSPPLSSDIDTFRLVAMSDMQRDGAFPGKFQEIVEEGVIALLEKEIGGELIDNLALVMIPGDLVQDGNDFSSWQRTFFQPAEKLFSHVPVYPVPGNHENNAAYFFTYFKMPDNGTAGFEEHWWKKDYGNVRIIGLDSNSPFDGLEQLEWLDNLLDSTCQADSIDFVFAQLHHPFKSELWTPGEKDYTGEVVRRLEQFSTNCNKPSIHFFGHTHGYSRGQSRDHKHLWINVATAGGAIDNWGEFPNFDYEEFSVSQDEYGFVVVEITDGADPGIFIRRVSRGDQDTILNNIITDSLTIKLNRTEVHTPLAVFPQGEEIAPECVTLKANAFSSPVSGSIHGQSHWQVDLSAGDFSTPVAEHWNNFENWYNEVDTQSEDDLTDESIFELDEFSAYKWRVRYRDREMNWSSWSVPAFFNTKGSVTGPNLLSNHGAEDGLEAWTIVEGVVESLLSNECDGVPAYAGDRYFAAGGLCEHSPVGRAIQNIDVSAYVDSIDNGTFMVSFGGYLSNFSGSDKPEMKLIFLDTNGLEIGQSMTLSTLNSSWTMLNEVMKTPALTRTIQVELKGTRNAGTDNDSYFDNLYLRLGSNAPCDPVTSIVNQPIVIKEVLKIFPNPTNSTARINVPEIMQQDYHLLLTDLAGHKIHPEYKSNGETILLETRGLSKGSYFIWLRSKSGLLAVGKLIVL